MKKIITTILSFFLFFSFSSFSNAKEAEVVHWWVSGGEQAAISVFAKAWEAKGNTWIDTAITGGENARGTTVNRIMGGDPPTAAQFNISRQFEDLITQGKLQSLEELAQQEGWRDFIYPKQLIDVCVRDGEFWCVPVNIHSAQWMWTNTSVFKNAGVAEPDTIDDFLAAAPKLKDSGVIPLALGGQPWQEGLMFGVVFSSEGYDLMQAILKDHDVDSARGPRFRNVLENYRELQQWVDDGAPGRLWNDATAMVIEGKAGMQIMGDWARGEFQVAGLVPKNEYNCIIPGKKKYVELGGDVFVFPKSDDPAVKEAQYELASLMVNPTVQANFNNAKGSLPMRLDVDMSAADACMKMGLELIKDPDHIMEGSGIWNTNDFVSSWEDIISEFRNNPNQTIDDTIDQVADLLESGI